MRLQKGIRFTERFDLQLMASVYNIANHQNYTTSDVNENAYNFGSTTVPSGQPQVGSQANPAVLTYQSSFGTPSAANNSGFLYTPRNIELGARLTF
jgi:hypothetical protein